MTAQDMDSLYHANLYINVGTLNNDRQLRGRIVQNLISPAQELSKRPILLQSRNVYDIIHKSTNLKLFSNRLPFFIVKDLILRIFGILKQFFCA